MLGTAALLESPTESIAREDVPCMRIDPTGALIEYEMPGYIHSPGYLATAYIYGRWAHSTRADDFAAMAQKFGVDSDYETLTRFTFKAGHGFMAVAYAFACEMLEAEAPEVKKDVDLFVKVSAVLPTLRRAEKVLREKAIAATKASPKETLQNPPNSMVDVSSVRHTSTP